MMAVSALIHFVKSVLPHHDLLCDLTASSTIADDGCHFLLADSCKMFAGNFHELNGFGTHSMSFLFIHDGTASGLDKSFISLNFGFGVSRR